MYCLVSQSSKYKAWKPGLIDLPYKFYALAHEPGRISDQASDLLDNLINRLHLSDRPRLRTYCYQLIAATTTLGVARVIRACLPIRCDSSNRVLPLITTTTMGVKEHLKGVQGETLYA